MTQIVSQEPIAGFEAPVHRALTEPILLAGAPRAVAILNGTVSACPPLKMNSASLKHRPYPLLIFTRARSSQHLIASIRVTSSITAIS
jgi:hypothetical protein